MSEYKLDIKLSGLILAGGEGRRMAGRDKGLISLANKPLVEYAIECLQPLVDDLSISCFQDYGFSKNNLGSVTELYYSKDRVYYTVYFNDLDILYFSSDL